MGVRRLRLRYLSVGVLEDACPRPRRQEAAGFRHAWRKIPFGKVGPMPPDDLQLMLLVALLANALQHRAVAVLFWPSTDRTIPPAVVPRRSDAQMHDAPSQRGPERGNRSRTAVL